MVRIAESRIKCNHCKKGRVTRAAWYKLKLDIPDDVDRETVEELLEQEMVCPICAGTNYQAVRPWI